MKRKYITPLVSVEMFDIEVTILDGSNMAGGGTGDNGDRSQAPIRHSEDDGYDVYENYGDDSNSSGWGSLW